jgi:hypothetical protein
MRSSRGWTIELGVSIPREIVVDINMVLFSAIRLHTLPMSAQCDYKANDNGGYRELVKYP